MRSLLAAFVAVFSTTAHAALPLPPDFGNIDAALRPIGSVAAPPVGQPRTVWTEVGLDKSVDNPWKRVLSPTRGAPESIGSVSAGCLRGGVLLEKSGPGYQAMRLSRRRFFGHPRLVQYLTQLSGAARDAGLGTVLIGDMGQARGGPTLSGHVSHQSGLDVDVWFLLAPHGRVLSDEERETWSAPQMVVPDFERLSTEWDPRIVDMLRLAAQDSAVDRIFVNPVVKKAVCEKHKNEGWVQKIRPYWFHDNHFHARLKCQPGSPHCKSQDPVPAGDGCGAELAGWFTPERKAEARRMREAPSTERTLPALPPECAKVLREP
ncbi:MAG: penicillin-insensitive murein endopeptidase [Elusimicrobia bacterium]|nr:penicillin-insensitive murein endopeptidase [Elusimicrobiota bacterium]